MPTQIQTAVEIDPTAIIRGDVEFADDVVIGPGCVLDGTLGPVRIGAGTTIIGSAYLYGPLQVGAYNTVYPGACLGFAPQARSFSPDTPGRGLVIGDHNVFREHVAIHRAMTDAGPTRIGDNNYFMAYSHAGHDCRVGDRCTFANGAQLGGHVAVHDDVTVGGMTPVHQFCQLGRGCMLSGGVAASLDVAPFFMLTGVNVIGSLNRVGMRRQKMSIEDREDVKWVYKTLYRRGLPAARALAALEERDDRPIVAEYVRFIRASTRGLCRGREQPLRNA